jgi:hypothetical protein
MADFCITSFLVNLAKQDDALVSKFPDKIETLIKLKYLDEFDFQVYR